MPVKKKTHLLPSSKEFTSLDNDKDDGGGGGDNGGGGDRFLFY